MQFDNYRIIMPERDVNQEAFDQVEKATESEPVKGEDLLEFEDPISSGGIKRRL